MDNTYLCIYNYIYVWLHQTDIFVTYYAMIILQYYYFYIYFSSQVHIQYIRSCNDISVHYNKYLPGQVYYVQEAVSVQNILYTACVQLSNYRYSEMTEIACDFYAVREPHSIWYRSKNWIFGRTTIIVFRVGYRTICVDQCTYLDHETLIRPRSKTLL